MQKVVRTYPHGYTNTTHHLQKLLEEGYKVVMCNESPCDGGKCLEYIVEKED